MSKVDLKRDCEKRRKNRAGRKHKRDAKLQELEKQLAFAESRCGTLKQQLDYIKLLYGCGKCKNSKEEGHGDGSNVNQFEYEWKDENIEAREDGDCPDIMKQTTSHTNTTSTNSSNKRTSPVSNQVNEEEPPRKGGSKLKNNSKLLKFKKKNCKKAKKRRKGDDVSSKVSNASSQTFSQVWQDPLVEIYKNSTLNVESESGFDIVCKRNKTNKDSEILGNAKKSKLLGKTENPEETKEKGPEDYKGKSCDSLAGRRKGCNVFKEEGMQTDLPLEPSQPVLNKRNDPPDLPNKDNPLRTEMNFVEPLKNYCQPTISSKRKQVERDLYSNLTNLNVRNIPFIAARSTAPSHNIGVNIQQVLSIIKKRHLFNDSPASPECGSQESPLLALLGSRKLGATSEAGTAPTSSSDSKRRFEGVRSSLSHWRSHSEFEKERSATPGEKSDDNQAQDWSLKVSKLKKVLVFLHEDFTSLSQKYKRLQKKLTKRNITKTDAKDELADIERELEKKEEEITVVIGLYKEVLSLKEDFKKLQEKYNLVARGRTFMFDGLRQSNSTHVQMTTLLRKIQNFQDQLKG